MRIKMKTLCILVNICFYVRAEDQITIENSIKPAECDHKSTNGSVIVVKFTAYLSNGTKFDSSADRFTGPATHAIGAEDAIPGFDQGVIGMCVGEKRSFTVPPSLGYGDEGIPGLLPGGETIKFEVELVDIVSPSSYESMFEIIDKNGDKLASREEVRAYFLNMLEMRRRNSRDDLKIEDILGNTDEVMDNLFKSDDIDKDGLISEEEFVRARKQPRESEANGASPNQTEKRRDEF